MYCIEWVLTICMQVYGYQYLLSMNNLEAAGLLKVQEGGRAFFAIKQNLRLCNHEVDEKNPTDISYCYSGYAPLSVRLVEHLTKNNSWSGIEEVSENIGVTKNIIIPCNEKSLEGEKIYCDRGSFTMK